MQKQITRATEIKTGKLDWAAIGGRFKQFREYKGISKLDAGKVISMGESSVNLFEIGRDRVATNIVWIISHEWDLSINWLVNGIGSYHDADPVELLPETLIIQKGAGIRRSQNRLQAETGEFTDHMLEFVTAIDKFKRVNDMQFPTWTQIYEVILALGYRKSAPARIAPLGYVVEHQQQSEKLKQIEEKEEREEVGKRGNLPKRSKVKGCSFEPDYVPPGRKLSLIKYNKKRRAKRNHPPKLSHKESERRRKIGEKVKQAHRSGQKQFLVTDPNGKQHVVEGSFAQFCKSKGLQPSHMYSTANGERKQHKGWKAETIKA